MISEAMLPADRLAGDFPISLLLRQYRCWRTKIIVAAVTDSQSPQKKTELNELFKKNVDLGLHSSATAKIQDERARPGPQDRRWQDERYGYQRSKSLNHRHPDTLSTASSPAWTVNPSRGNVSSFTCFRQKMAPIRKSESGRFVAAPYA